MSVSIDIGPGATNGDSPTGSGALFTCIDYGNPCNLSGTLDTFQCWALSPLSDLKMGTFYGSGLTYTRRDSTTIGSVSTGSCQTFTGKSVSVSADDLLGFYFSSGLMNRYDTGHSGFCYKYVDGFDGEGYTYTNYSNGANNTYATGTSTHSASPSISPSASPSASPSPSPSTSPSISPSISPSRSSSISPSTSPSASPSKSPSISPSTSPSISSSVSPSASSSTSPSASPSVSSSISPSVSPSVSSSISPSVSPSAGTQIEAVRIDSSSDDGGRNSTDSDLYLTRAYREVSYTSSTSAWEASFLRFPDVDIPQGSDIVAVRIELVAYDNFTGGEFKLWINDEDDAVAPTTAEEYDAKVWDYAVSSYVSGQIQNAEYQITGLVYPVQQIVDRVGWASGNALMFKLEHDSAYFNDRDMLFYDYSGDATKCARIVIDYFLSSLSPSKSPSLSSSISPSVSPSSSLSPSESPSISPSESASISPSESPSSSISPSISPSESPSSSLSPSESPSTSPSISSSLSSSISPSLSSSTSPSRSASISASASPSWSPSPSPSPAAVYNVVSVTIIETSAIVSAIITNSEELTYSVSETLDILSTTVRRKRD